MKTKKQITFFISFISLISITLIFLLIPLSSNDFFISTESEAIAAQSTLTLEKLNKQPSKLTKISKKEVNVNFFTVKSNKPQVYLTFDDGPTKFTPIIVNTLNKQKIKATFFMLNNNILNKPDLVQTLKMAGHSIGCHGVTHQIDKFYGSASAPLKEMNTCNQSIQKTTGKPTNLVRVPYGSYPHLTLGQKTQLEKSNYIMWDWNVDSLDWKWKNKSANLMVNHIMTQVKSMKAKGKDPVILLHDTEVASQALPKLIQNLKDMGYEFKAISNSDIPVQFKLKK